MARMAMRWARAEDCVTGACACAKSGARIRDCADCDHATEEYASSPSSLCGAPSPVTYDPMYVHDQIDFRVESLILRIKLSIHAQPSWFLHGHACQT